MRTVLLGNDYIETSDGNFKFLETNTNVTFELGVEMYSDLSELLQFCKNNTIRKIIVLSNTPLFSQYLQNIFVSNGFEFETIKIKQNSSVVPDVEDGDDILIIRLAYDYSAVVDTEYAADKLNFYNLIKDEDFAIKTYFKGNTIDNFINSNDNYPNYVIKGNVPNLDIKDYPKYYKFNSIEEAQYALNNLKDWEMMSEFYLSTTMNDKISTIRSLDLLFEDLSVINLGSYYKTMFFSKEETGEFEYDETGKLYDKYRYALTNDLKPNEVYSGNETDELLDANGNSILYSDLQKGMIVKTLSISDLPKEDQTNLTGLTVQKVSYMAWVSTFENLKQNTIITTNQIYDYKYSVGSTWMGKMILDNGFEWEDSYFTKMIIKKPNTDQIRFLEMYNWEVGDVIYFWNRDTNEYIENTIINIENVWKENVILYQVDVIENDVYLTNAYDNIQFVQHNRPIRDCDCCSSALYCGFSCCLLSCPICIK
jgi:hypothetical protein